MASLPGWTDRQRTVSCRKRGVAFGGEPAYKAPPPFAGWSSPVARQAHNLKVISSNLVPATKFARHVLDVAGVLILAQRQSIGPTLGIRFSDESDAKTQRQTAGYDPSITVLIFSASSGVAGL